MLVYPVSLTYNSLSKSTQKTSGLECSRHWVYHKVFRVHHSYKRRSQVVSIQAANVCAAVRWNSGVSEGAGMSPYELMKAAHPHRI